MKVGKLVMHEWYGMGVIIAQQGVVDRWYVHFIKAAPYGVKDKHLHCLWSKELSSLGARFF